MEATKADDAPGNTEIGPLDEEVFMHFVNVWICLKKYACICFNSVLSHRFIIIGFTLWEISTLPDSGKTYNIFF